MGSTDLESAKQNKWSVNKAKNDGQILDINGCSTKYMVNNWFQTIVCLAEQL
jgi:hypothetical protein